MCSSDLQMVVVALEGGQIQQEASAGTADVEHQRQLGVGEELGRGRQGPRQLVETAERIDVLPHLQPSGTRKPQLAV